MKKLDPVTPKKKRTGFFYALAFAIIVVIFLLLIRPYYNKVESEFEFPGVKIKFKAEGNNYLEAKSAPNSETSTIIISASSITPWKTSDMIQSSAEINEIWSSPDGRTRQFSVTIQPGRTLTVSSPATVSIMAMPLSSQRK